MAELKEKVTGTHKNSRTHTNSNMLSRKCCENKRASTENV